MSFVRASGYRLSTTDAERWRNPHSCHIMKRPMRDPRQLFFALQVLIGAAFLFAAWRFLRPRSSESNFRVREADLRRGQKPGSGEDVLGASRMKRPAEPLRLEGIRLDVPPHQLLGVAPQASTAEIQRAYRELMKRYHPDRVAPVDTPQWREAQRIADAIHRAKEEMLKRARS